MKTYQPECSYFRRIGFLLLRIRKKLPTAGSAGFGIKD